MHLQQTHIKKVVESTTGLLILRDSGAFLLQRITSLNVMTDTLGHWFGGLHCWQGSPSSADSALDFRAP